jgi:hypothetical protein
MNDFTVRSGLSTETGAEKAVPKPLQRQRCEMRWFYDYGLIARNCAAAQEAAHLLRSEAVEKFSSIRQLQVSTLPGEATVMSVTVSGEADQ